MSPPVSGDNISYFPTLFNCISYCG